MLTEQAKKLVAISENFIAELSNLQKGYSPFELTGTIDLYTTEPLLDNFLAKPLSQLYKIYPKLNIEIHAFSYEKTIQQILQKNYHTASGISAILIKKILVEIFHSSMSLCLCYKQNFFAVLIKTII